jgi:hypothetical protein
MTALIANFISPKAIMEKVAVLALLGIAFVSTVGAMMGTGADLPMLLQ